MIEEVTEIISFTDSPWLLVIYALIAIFTLILVKRFVTKLFKRIFFLVIIVGAIVTYIYLT